MIKITNATAIDTIETELLLHAERIRRKGQRDYSDIYMDEIEKRSSLVFYYAYDGNNWYMPRNGYTERITKEFIAQINIDDNIDYLCTEVYKNAVRFHIISDVYGIMEE